MGNRSTAWARGRCPCRGWRPVPWNSGWVLSAIVCGQSERLPSSAGIAASAGRPIANASAAIAIKGHRLAGALACVPHRHPQAVAQESAAAILAVRQRHLSQENARPPAASLVAEQRRFDRRQRIYNEERPHQAPQRPPAKPRLCRRLPGAPERRNQMARPVGVHQPSAGRRAGRPAGATSRRMAHRLWADRTRRHRSQRTVP